MFFYPEEDLMVLWTSCNWMKKFLLSKKSKLNATQRWNFPRASTTCRRQKYLLEKKPTCILSEGAPIQFQSRGKAVKSHPAPSSNPKVNPIKSHPDLNSNQGLGHLSSELLKCQRAGLRFDFLDHNMCKTRLLGEAAHKPALRTHFRTKVASRQKKWGKFLQKRNLSPRACSESWYAAAVDWPGKHLEQEKRRRIAQPAAASELRCTRFHRIVHHICQPWPSSSIGENLHFLPSYFSFILESDLLKWYHPAKVISKILNNIFIELPS